MNAMLDKVMSTAVLRIPFFLSIAAGAVISIATGFYLTFQLVVEIGSRW